MPWLRNGLEMSCEPRRHDGTERHRNDTPPRLVSSIAVLGAAVERAHVSELQEQSMTRASWLSNLDWPISGVRNMATSTGTA
jgi:hypothetical protein